MAHIRRRTLKTERQIQLESQRLDLRLKYQRVVAGWVLLGLALLAVALLSMGDIKEAGITGVMSVVVAVLRGFGPSP